MVSLLPALPSVIVSLVPNLTPIVYLYNMCLSVRDNIAFGKPEATLEEVKQAALLANAHTYANPHHHDTPLCLSREGLTYQLW
jgi:ABC-type multidrug transport system fused ATPase/permease subunit